jgi:hypothetical protein
MEKPTGIALSFLMETLTVLLTQRPRSLVVVSSDVLLRSLDLLDKRERLVSDMKVVLHWFKGI